jgi:hypothetical protein
MRCRRVGTARTTATDYVLRYFQDKHNELRSGQPTLSFQVERPASPEQHNIYCGYFACQLANFLTSDVPLDLEEADMVLFRDRLAAVVLQGSATAPASPPRWARTRRASTTRAASALGRTRTRTLRWRGDA